MAFDFSNFLRSGGASNTLGEAYREGQDIARQDAEAQRKALAQQQAVRDQQAQRTGIAAALSSGDYTKAAATALAYGDEKVGTAFTNLGKETYDRAGKNNINMANMVNEVGKVPYEQRRAVIETLRPMLELQGMSSDAIRNFDPTDANIAALSRIDYSYGTSVDDGIKKQNANTSEFTAQTGRIAAEQPVVVSPGQALVTRSGQETYRAPNYISAPTTSNVIEVAGTSSDGYTTGTRLAPGSVTAEQLYRNAIEPQESGGRAGAIGPQTRYGRAQGASQMLPATAQSMAQKLNIPWRPDLMTAKSPEGLEYQRKLGIAYTQEALDRTGGDPRAAAAFYHGGPDTRIHGPKTQAYADQVMTRLGRAINPQDTTRSTRVIQQGVDPAKVATSAAKDRQAVLGGVSSTDIAIRSANDLLGHPGLSAAVGSGFDPASYGKINPLTGKPFAGTNAANFSARLDTFKAQTFLPQVAALKGMGALSDAEGKKLTDAVGALSVNMSEDEFKSSLRVIITDLQAARTRAVGILRTAPASANGGGASSVPAAAQAKLRANPALSSAFDLKYGPGAAAKVLGR